MVESLRPGAILDRYELVSRAGAGGMGTVWRARMQGAFGFQKDVALKLMLPELADDEHQRKMFLDEARVAGRLSHPNVAQVLDVGEADGRLFHVIEWIDGLSFDHLLRRADRERAPLSLGVILRIVADAAAGLHAAHELTGDSGEPLGVIHRDASPHNVLVGRSGVAKVIDFGIAHSNVRQATATRTGFAKGKPSYLAPEQAMRFAVDRRADVWALGASLYRAFVGHPPFETVEQLVAFIYNTSPLLPLPAETPGLVGAVVSRAMAIEPRHRFGSAAEMVEAIEAVLSTLALRGTHADVARALASDGFASADRSSHPPTDRPTTTDRTSDDGTTASPPREIA